MPRAEREYDIQRKKATLATLESGFRRLKCQKAYKDKPVTKYALSKYTGIAKQTINNYPEIMDLLNKEKENDVEIKTPYGKQQISSMEAAVELIEKLTIDYNKLAEQLKVAKQKNTSINLTVAKQDAEIRRLKVMIDRYEEGL